MACFDVTGGSLCIDGVSFRIYTKSGTSASPGYRTLTLSADPGDVIVSSAVAATSPNGQDLIPSGFAYNADNEPISVDYYCGYNASWVLICLKRV